MPTEAAYPLALLAFGAPLAFVTDQNAVVGLATAVLGGGGIIGIVKLWMTMSAKRDERADARLQQILEMGCRERDEHHRDVTTLFEKMTSATEKLTEEVRGMREDQKAGLACRFSDIPVEFHTARPASKPNGTRGG